MTPEVQRHIEHHLMTLSIPDDILRQAGLTEKETLAELACRLFDADRLDFNTAARLAGLDRPEFESELLKRKLAIVHYTEADFEQDLRTIAHLTREQSSRAAPPDAG